MINSFKLLIIGDAGVGKTSLMKNYLKEAFVENELPTIGVEFGSQSVCLNNILSPDLAQAYEENYQESYGKSLTREQIKLQIWNTSGQERFHSIVTNYYRNIDGVIFVCDLTRKHTLANLANWVKDFRKYSNRRLEDVGAVVVATKTDLVSFRQIDNLDLEKFCEKYNFPFFTISSKIDRKKIELIFNNLINQMTEKYLENLPDRFIDQMNIVRLTPQKEKSGCCVIL